MSDVKSTEIQLDVIMLRRHDRGILPKPDNRVSLRGKQMHNNDKTAVPVEAVFKKKKEILCSE